MRIIFSSRLIVATGASTACLLLVAWFGRWRGWWKGQITGELIALSALAISLVVLAWAGWCTYLLWRRNALRTSPSARNAEMMQMHAVALLPFYPLFTSIGLVGGSGVNLVQQFEAEAVTYNVEVAPQFERRRDAPDRVAIRAGTRTNFVFSIGTRWYSKSLQTFLQTYFSGPTPLLTWVWPKTDETGNGWPHSMSATTSLSRTGCES